jgi:hypothetical protein
MAREFNPLKIIILFEKVLLTDSLEDNTKILVYDLINIINGKETIDDIQNDYRAYVYQDKTIPETFNIKEEIEKIIPKLMKFCDAENMMKCFTNRLNNV